MEECEELHRNVEPFLINIITDPNYKPTPDLFLKVTFDIYSITTLNPQHFSFSKDDCDENPFNDPFENVFNYLLKFSEQLFSEFNFDEDKEFMFNQLHSVKQRINTINHAFRYLNKQIPSFILNANQCKFGYQIALSFFMIFEQYFDLLIDKSIENVEPLFTSDKEPDFSYLINLYHICLQASKAIESSSEYIKLQFNKINHTKSNYDQIYEVYGHNKILGKLKDLFDIHKYRFSEEEDVKDLPRIAEYFYHFLQEIKNPSTKIELYNLFYKYFVEKRAHCCFTKLTGSKLVLFEDEEKMNYLKLLSFHNETYHYVEDYFKQYLNEFIELFKKPMTIRNMAAEFTKFLDYVDAFNDLMYEDIFSNEKKKFSKFILETTKSRFRDVKFSRELDESFSVVLSSIIDYFMKKGDNLSNRQASSTINLDRMIQLILYVIDRDVFLSHHTNYMFIRIATRSTISIKDEKKFLEKVQDVVKNTINFTNAFELIQQAENELMETKNKTAFNYYIIRHIYAPANRKFPLVPLPKEYKDFISISENSLAKKWKERKYEWIHYLTTVNVRISRNKRYVLLTMSLGQFAVFTALFKNPNLTIKDLSEITTIEESYLDTIIKSFKNSKFIKFDKDNSKISLDESFMPRQVVNLCDNWTPQYAPKVKNLEVQGQRKKSVQAAIVKIMKKFKMLRTQQLVDLVTVQVSNLYEVKEEEVMAAIRELVADEYLEETEGGAQLGYLE